MVDYARAAATAKRLVEANGRAVTLYRANRTPDDPAKPWRGSSEAPASSGGGLSISVRAAFVPAGGGLGGVFGRELVDVKGSLEVQLDQVALVAADSVVKAGAPASAVEDCDAILDGGQVWKVVVRGELRPSTRSLLFVLGLTR